MVSSILPTAVDGVSYHQILQRAVSAAVQGTTSAPSLPGLAAPASVAAASQGPTGSSRLQEHAAAQGAAPRDSREEPQHRNSHLDATRQPASIVQPVRTQRENAGSMLLQQLQAGQHHHHHQQPHTRGHWQQQPAMGQLMMEQQRLRQQLHLQQAEAHEPDQHAEHASRHCQQQVAALQQLARRLGDENRALQGRVQQAEQQSEEYQRQARQLQGKLDEARREAELQGSKSAVDLQEAVQELAPAKQACKELQEQLKQQQEAMAAAEATAAADRAAEPMLQLLAAGQWVAGAADAIAAAGIGSEGQQQQHLPMVQAAVTAPQGSDGSTASNHAEPGQQPVTEGLSPKATRPSRPSTSQLRSSGSGRGPATCQRSWVHVGSCSRSCGVGTSQRSLA